MSRNIRSLDMMVLDDVLEMHGGYVLNFSDRTFGNFFAEELEINIDDPKYSVEGSSKAKRLRYFLQNEDKATVVRALNALWEYREVIRNRNGKHEPVNDAEASFKAVVSRLRGVEQTAERKNASSPNGRAVDFGAFNDQLLKLAMLAPQPRGFAFETFLQDMFDVSGLAARGSFRLRGEQIDGSFVLGNETYLLEAKWQNALCGNGELHAFHGKLEQKGLDAGTVCQLRRPLMLWSRRRAVGLTLIRIEMRCCPATKML